MAKKCFVFRNEKGEIDKVLAPNEKESNLFKSLHELTEDKEEALRLWAQAYTPAFKSWFGDWEAIAKAKTFENKIQGFMKDIFKGNEEKFLFEMAQQANSSHSEEIGTLNTIGGDLFDIATTMFPDAKPGEEFKSNISRVIDENGEPMVVYHQTEIKDLKEFDKSKIGDYNERGERGFYFSPETDDDKFYGNERYPAFLNIKNPFLSTEEWEKVKVNPKNNDGVIATWESTGGPHTEIIAYEPNQIKSIYNNGDFSINDNIYQEKVRPNQIIGSLQSQGKLGKRISDRIYEVPLDSANVNLIDQQQKAYEIQQQINKQAGKELVQTSTTNDGKVVIKVNENINNKIKDLDPEDLQSYRKFLIDNLYTQKDNPTTTELINNAAKLAKDLGRQDLVDMARLINKYLVKNTSLSTRIVDSMFDDIGDDNVKAYYSIGTNKVTFARDKIGSGTLEHETSTVLHEMLHGLTAQAWQKVKTNFEPSQEEKDLMHVVDSYYNYFVTRIGADKSRHAFSDPEEFLMGALFDPSFRDHLSQLSKDKNVNPFVQFIKDLIKGILKLFGIKPDEKTIDKIDPDKIQSDLFSTLSDYLDKTDQISRWNALKEDGRNYGLSFAVTAEGDYNAESKRLREEKDKMKSPIGSDLRTQLKTSIDKSITSIKSFGSSIRKKIPESQEGFKTIFKQLKKLEDPAYNLDQVDFFFDFTSEIQALFNVADDKISRLLSDETIDDPDFKLKEYENIVSAIRSFDPILNEIQGIKIQLENLGYKESLKDLNDLNTKRDRIESIYSMGVFPLVTSKFVDILEPGSSKAIEIATERINQLDKRIALADKSGNKSRVLQLQKDRNQEQARIDKEFTLNSSKIQSWLRGEMGDSNILTTWTRAGVSNKNPLVSGLSKYLRDNIGEIAPKVLDLMNGMQDNMESYANTTGKSINDITSFNAPLIQTHKVITGKDEKGAYTYDDKNSLLHQFNNNHIQQLQKFKRDLTDLYNEKRDIENSPNIDEKKLDDTLVKIKALRDEQKQFIRDYMEQKYSPEVHEALDMLHEDLGGYTAWDYMGPVLSRIENTETAIEQEQDSARLADLYNQLDDHNLELSRLSSLYEKSPDSRELKVAEQLKKRKELLGKYSQYILTDKGRLQFETQMARMKRKLDRSEITPERYERWLEDNTVTELTQSYWDTKKNILNDLNGILTKMGATTEKDETVGKLYNEMEDITRGHRDSNGIIDGSGMTQKELLDVKNTEQKIEDAKDKIANVFGLTKLERIRLSDLSNQINELNTSIYMEQDVYRRQNLTDTKNGLQDEADDITSKKKKLDKGLLEQYFSLIKKLGELDEHSITKYYMDESDERLAQEIAKVDTSKMPAKFTIAGRTYQRAGNEWLEIGGGAIQKRENTYVENVYKENQGNINYKVSEWYRTNHITKTTFSRNGEYDPSNPGESYGEWVDKEEPTYAWRQTRPKEDKYINENQPSIKYKQRTIKDQYVNKNYKEDINGDLRPKVKGAKDDRFINKDYHRLVNSSAPSDVATAKMLKHLTDTYFNSQQSIPKGMRPGYDLPSIRKTDIERFTSKNLNQNVNDFFEYLGQLSRIVKDKTLTNEQDKDILYGYNDDFNGIVPIRFIGDISSKDQSIDLSKVILTFASEMLKREQLIKAMPFANAVKDIVNNTDNRPVKTKKGVIQSIKKKFLPKNTEVAMRSGTSNTALQINEIIKGEIYGETMKDQPGAKLVNTALGIGAKVMLGLNFISSVQNYANAFTQSIMETESKNKNFSGKSFFKAQKIYYAHIDELMADLGKYGNKSFLNQFFDYFGGINYKIFSKNHRPLAYGKVAEFTSALSVPNTITEHMLNYHMAIAIALDYRVSDGKGNMIPILDAFTMKDRKLVQKEGFNVSEKDRKEMISRLNTSSRRVNGEYGDRILLDKYALGRMATFMNRYLIPFISKRYGSRDFDIQDGVQSEGYWRLFGKLFIKDIKAKSLPIMGGWKYYTDTEKEAVYKASTEFGFTVMFSLMISALGGGDSKQIKDNSILANNLIYALKGIQQQNESFMPVPGVGFDDILRKVQNPFPIFGKVKNMVSLMNDGAHTLWWQMGLPGVQENDVKYMQNVGWHKTGDYKLFSDLQKLIGIQKVYNYFYPDQAIKAQESMSRIK